LFRFYPVWYEIFFPKFILSNNKKSNTALTPEVKVLLMKERLERDVPSLALHWINGESVGNYHLIDEESTGGRGFCRELPAHRQGMNPPEEGDSTGTHQLIYSDSGW
jgi:hypothetical protein